VVPGRHDSASVHEHIELRLARGAFGFSGFGTPSTDGGSLLWVRMPHVEHDAGALAIIADFMPSVVGNALGRIMHCTSLDNTIRFGRLEPTRWVLCDNRMEYTGNGFGHGSVHLWSESGTLLATASQSMIIRAPD
jgi:acyl-CoA thioesterase